MPTMSSLKTRRRLKSGNHGSDSSEQSVASGVQGTFSTAPQQSTKVFVPPVVSPVKPITKIKDVLKDPVIETQQTLSTKEESQAHSEQTVINEKPDKRIDKVDHFGDPDSETEVDTESTHLNETENEDSVSEHSSDDMSGIEKTETDDTSTDEKFRSAWNDMFELLFREIATIYYPLKDIVPPIKDNIIYLKVKNEMMKDSFESRIRLALEYLRKNYDPRIDDIVVEVDTSDTPATKLIYDTQDKMNDLRRENQDLPEFLKILNLSAKDM